MTPRRHDVVVVRLSAERYAVVIVDGIVSDVPVADARQATTFKHLGQAVAYARTEQEKRGVP